MPLRDRAFWALAVILSVTILIAPAIWNGFPLLQYDTGGYLARWYEGTLVPSRAVVYGLTAALWGEVTIKDGQVQQSNLHDYPLLRMSDCPRVETHIMASAEPPEGVGEPGVPPIAPAVANALFALTGQRLRALPLKLS